MTKKHLFLKVSTFVSEELVSCVIFFLCLAPAITPKWITLHSFSILCIYNFQWYHQVTCLDVLCSMKKLVTWVSLENTMCIWYKGKIFLKRFEQTGIFCKIVAQTFLIASSLVAILQQLLMSSSVSEQLQYLFTHSGNNENVNFLTFYH